MAAWPWLAIIAKNVPWVELARRAPDIWTKSRELLDESRRTRDAPPAAPTLDDLRRRVEALEQRDREHARLLAAMVEQQQALTESVRVLAARNRLLTWVTAALAAALVAAVALVRG